MKNEQGFRNYLYYMKRFEPIRIDLICESTNMAAYRAKYYLQYQQWRDDVAPVDEQ